MKQILSVILATMVVMFIMGRGSMESKRDLVNNCQIIAFANLLRMDLPDAAACSVGGKSSVHYATLLLAAGSDIKGHMPKNLSIKYRYT